MHGSILPASSLAPASDRPPVPPVIFQHTALGRGSFVTGRPCNSPEYLNKPELAADESSAHFRILQLSLVSQRQPGSSGESHICPLKQIFSLTFTKLTNRTSPSACKTRIFYLQMQINGVSSSANIFKPH